VNDSVRLSVHSERTTVPIDPDVPGDPYEVSDADTMLAYIKLQARKPQSIRIITKPGCPFCAKAMLA
jgi:hypothetical protein